MINANPHAIVRYRGLTHIPTPPPTPSQSLSRQSPIGEDRVSESGTPRKQDHQLDSSELYSALTAVENRAKLPHVLKNLKVDILLFKAKNRLPWELLPKISSYYYKKLALLMDIRVNRVAIDFLETKRRALTNFPYRYHGAHAPVVRSSPHSGTLVGKTDKAKELSQTELRSLMRRYDEISCKFERMSPEDVSRTFPLELSPSLLA